MQVNIQSKDGSTALIAAAIKGQVDVATFLIAHGADIDAVHSDGWTALIAMVQSQEARELAEEHEERLSALLLAEAAAAAAAAARAEDVNMMEEVVVSLESAAWQQQRAMDHRVEAQHLVGAQQKQR